MTPYDPTTDNVAPQRITWFAAQKRPLVAAHVGALGLLGAAVVSEGLPSVALGRVVWPGLLYYLAFLLSFLLPLWLVQAVVYSQMWQQGRPHFVAASGAEHLNPARRCRFLLSLRTHVFVLSVLYVESREREIHWTRPAWLFLALFATALLAFCLWTSFWRSLPAVLLLSTITFWSAALVFGLSHLVRGE